MKKPFVLLSILLALIIVSSSVSLSASTAGTNIIDLGTLGGDYTWVSDINNFLQIVGQSKPSQGYGHAFLWQKGSMLDLGTLGGTWSRADAINDRGQIVGSSETADGSIHGFLWENGILSDLGEDFGVIDINNNGDLLIRFRSNAEYAIWHEDGSVESIIGSFTGARKMNDHGAVIGRGPGNSAVIYKDGEVRILEGNISDAYDLNNHLQIAGTLDDEAYNIPYTGASTIGVFWENDTSRLIYTAYADRINEGGVIAGVLVEYDDFFREYIWKDGALFELDQILPHDYAW